MATLEANLATLITALGTDFKRRTIPVVFSAQSVLSVRTGKSKVQMLGSGTIVSVKGWLDTPATGATTFKVDINKNGTTIYGTQANQPTWTASANAATVGTHSVTTYADGDQLSCDIDAVGNTVAGSDLTITIWLLRTGD
jgi:hypothetical protein